MSQFPRYESYKDSGVQWLGEIPSHWEVIKNKFVLDFSKGLTITKKDLIDEGIPCVSYGEVHSKYGFEVDPELHLLKCVSDSYLETNNNALLRKGDFIFADTSEDIKGSGNFTYLNSDIPVFAGYHTIIAKIKGLNNPRFLAYVFDTEEHRNQIRIQVRGVKVFSITQAILKNTLSWSPPINEQKIIANFLDKQLAKIDALIAKQETLLKKLEEQRIALISQAVTKGLDPNVEMKDSGIEWLGEVPKHWSVIKNKFVFNFSKGLTITRANLIDEGIPCVSYGEVHSKFGFEVDPDKHELGFVSEAYLESDPNSLLKYGDFIFADTSEDIKGSGNFTYLNSNYPIFAGYHTVIAKMSQKNNPRFLAYVFDTEEHRNQIRAGVKGVKVFSITQAILKNTFVWMPSVEEQSRIVRYLDVEVKKYQIIGEKYQLTINRLKEYRLTLITQAVTGKIDVRNINVN